MLLLHKNLQYKQDKRTPQQQTLLPVGSIYISKVQQTHFLFATDVSPHFPLLKPLG